MTSKDKVKPAPATIEKEAVPEITFAKSAKSRTLDVPLEWPLLVDGVELKKVTVKRLTGREVSEFQERMQETDFSDEAMMAQFVDQPQAVLDALDQDDFQTVKAKVVDFLPRRVREALDQAQEEFLTGDT